MTFDPIAGYHDRPSYHHVTAPPSPHLPSPWAPLSSAIGAGQSLSSHPDPVTKWQKMQDTDPKGRDLAAPRELCAAHHNEPQTHHHNPCAPWAPTPLTLESNPSEHLSGKPFLNLPELVRVCGAPKRGSLHARFVSPVNWGRESYALPGPPQPGQVHVCSRHSWGSPRSPCQTPKPPPKGKAMALSSILGLLQRACEPLGPWSPFHQHLD